MAQPHWRIYLGAGTGLVAAYLVLPQGGVGEAAIHIILHLVTVVAIVTAVSSRDPVRRAWLLLAAGHILYGVADGIWYTSPPFPSPADALYLISYALFVAGLTFIVKQRTHKVDRAGLLDSLILTMGMVALSWVFLIEPQIEATNLELQAKLISLAYPIMDMLLLAVLTRLLFSAATRTPSFWFLTIGFFLQLIADTAYARALLEGTFHLGHPIGAGWLFSFILVGVAALHPSRQLLSQRATSRENSSAGWRVVLLGAAAVIPPLLQIVRALMGNVGFVPVIASLSVIVFVLVLSRVANLMSDLQQRKEIEVALRNAEKKYRSLVEHIPAVVYVDAIDDLASTHYIAPTIEALTGFTAEEWLARPGMWLEQMHPEDLDRILPIHKATNETGEPFEVEYRLFHRNGEVVWVRDECVMVTTSDGRFWQGVLADISDRKRADEERDRFEKELKHQALHDSLTGLPNRALFSDRLDHALSRLSRSGDPLTVFFLDVDNFKRVNDTLGHAAGDTLLVQVAERVAAALRPSDTLARLGGDEFAVLVEDLSGEPAMVGIADRITAALRTRFTIGEQQVPVSASIGIAIGDSRLWTAQDFLRNADVAMYSAKLRNKGGNAVFHPDMHKAVARRVELEQDLGEAIEHEDLQLNYHPIVELQAGQIVGFEALLRWNHPTHGPISPGEFIPLAEDTGLIIPLGRWALEEACRQLQRWHSRVPGATSLYVSVNLSVKQVIQAEINAEVRRALNRSGLSPNRLVLEVTESALMERTDETIRKLQAMRAIGIRIAIDDFGTGYSSLAYLSRFPIDILKIDKSFVDGVSEGAEEGALARAVIKIGESLSLQTIAEGIESEDQRGRLLALGCKFGQGFLFARPLDAQQAESILTGDPDRQRALTPVGDA